MRIDPLCLAEGGEGEASWYGPWLGGACGERVRGRRGGEWWEVTTSTFTQVPLLTVKE